MKLIERVKYSLLGKPVKTLLLLLVVTLLGSFLSASFSVYQANNELVKEIKTKLKPIVLIEWEINNQNNELSFQEEELLKTKLIEEYKTNQNISLIENRFLLYNGDIKLIINNENKQYYGTQTFYGYTNENDEWSQYIGGYIFDLVGVDNYNLEPLLSDDANLKYGRTFAEEEITNEDEVYVYSFSIFENSVEEEIFKSTNELIINEEVLIFESFNNYSIPHFVDFDYELTLKQIGGIQQKDYSKIVKGFSELTTGYGVIISSSLMDKISEDLKEMYQQIKVQYPWYEFDNFGMKYLADTYIELENIDMLNDFVDDIEKNDKGLIRTITTYADSYNDVQVITKNLNTIAIICLVVCMIASIIILSLIIQVFIHERRYEIGVFLSLGESRRNVITQIILEVLIVGMIGISISLFTGNVIANTLSDDLMEKQIAQHMEIHDGMSDTTDYEISQEEILDTYSVDMSVEYIVCVYAGGLAVLMLSCLYPTRSIMKMKAKKMLQ